MAYEESPQMVKLRASIGKVLYRKNALETVLKGNFDKMYGVINHVIYSNLESLGEKVVERAQQLILASAPAGKQYTIVDEDWEILVDPYNASVPEAPPHSITNLLYESITYRVRSGGDRADFVEVGVWSQELWEYETIAFYGPNPKKDRDYGVIVTGDGGHTHPVALYAAAMEYGTPLVEPRPFMAPAFNELVIQIRKELQQEIKAQFMSLFGKKIPITFRIYAKEAITPEWEEY